MAPNTPTPTPELCPPTVSVQTVTGGGVQSAEGRPTAGDAGSEGVRWTQRRDGKIGCGRNVPPVPAVPWATVINCKMTGCPKCHLKQQVEAKYTHLHTFRPLRMHDTVSVINEKFREPNQPNACEKTNVTGRKIRQRRRLTI